jgi:hypothetical protein
MRLLARLFPTLAKLDAWELALLPVGLVMLCAPLSVVAASLLAWAGLIDRGLAIP